ncbi:hypothetical protein BKA57DRAFT_70879 [Linnemannia elongata]|nr:hypothetical protein BKA57DRAFT_70879 [Linnemannia elongata]
MNSSLSIDRSGNDCKVREGIYVTCLFPLFSFFLLLFARKRHAWKQREISTMDLTRMTISYLYFCATTTIELDGAAPDHLEQLPMYNPPSGPVPTSTYTSSSSPADQGTSGTGPTPTSTAPLPQPVPHAQPYLVAPASTPAATTASHTTSAPGYNAPPPPQPLPAPTPSDLPPSYDEIR